MTKEAPIPNDESLPPVKRAKLTTNLFRLVQLLGGFVGLCFMAYAILLSTDKADRNWALACFLRCGGILAVLSAFETIQRGEFQSEDWNTSKFKTPIFYWVTVITLFCIGAGLIFAADHIARYFTE
ncbi:MAG: hypothetical protein R3F13_06695 [Prosthecobacter sp.]